MKSLLKKHRELIMYGLNGIPTVLSNFGTYFLLAEMNLSTAICAFVAMCVSIVVAYVTNKLFVFRTKRNRRLELFLEFVSFVSCRLLSGSVEVIIMVVTVDFFMLAEHEAFIKVCATIVVVLLNYVASKQLVFRQKD